jgi:hypothetical protein
MQTMRQTHMCAGARAPPPLPARASGLAPRAPGATRTPRAAPPAARPTRAPRAPPAAYRRHVAAAASGGGEVRFEVPGCRVEFGQAVKIVGSAEALGAWDAARGLSLAWGEGDVWTGAADVPAGEPLDFKVVVAAGDAAVHWEEGENRVAEGPAAGGALRVSCAFGGEMRVEVEAANAPAAEAAAPAPAAAQAAAAPAPAAAAALAPAAAPKAAAAAPASAAAAAPAGAAAAAPAAAAVSAALASAADEPDFAPLPPAVRAAARGVARDLVSSLPAEMAAALQAMDESADGTIILSFSDDEGDDAATLARRRFAK